MSCILFMAGMLLAGSMAIAEPEPPRVDRYGDPLPLGAVARLGTVRFRHGGYGLKALSFLPDGKTLVGAGEERSIIFWDAETGLRLREINTGELNIRGFGLSRDGKRIAVSGFWYPGGGAGKGAIRILETATGKVLQSFAREPRGMDSGSLAFTPDGKLLLSYAADGILRVEEISSGAEILQHRFAADNGPFMAMSSDGERVAVITGPNTRKLYV